MESVILLNSNENTQQVEEEERSRFVRGVLEALGLPVEDIWDNDGTLSFENRVRLRSIISAYNIQVITSLDGEVQIYHQKDDGEDELIGEWKKPSYVLKQDYKAKDPRKKLYLEMKTNFWTLFENT